MSSPSEKRLRKELTTFVLTPTPGLRLDQEQISRNIREWIVEIDSAADSIYQGQTFQLKFKFNDRYPFDSPSVTFIGRDIPEHKHIYSNGHICLSILSDDWTPALSVHAVCLSILSMLSKAEKKERPPDDLVYTRTCNSNPKRTKWMFHDDTV